MCDSALGHPWHFWKQETTRALPTSETSPQKAHIFHGKKTLLVCLLDLLQGFVKARCLYSSLCNIRHMVSWSPVHAGTNTQLRQWLHYYSKKECESLSMAFNWVSNVCGASILLLKHKEKFWNVGQGRVMLWGNQHHNGWIEICCISVQSCDHHTLSMTIYFLWCSLCSFYFLEKLRYLSF